MAKNKNKQPVVVVSRQQVKNKKKQNKMSYKAGPSRMISTTQPAARSFRIESREPLITTTRNSSRVVHREKVIANIPGSLTFLVAYTLQLNPGLSGVFPWLSQIAKNWEQYRVNSMKAIYIPIAPTNTQGDVLLTPSYDSSNPPPATEEQASNDVNSVENACHERIEMDLVPQSLMAGVSRKYVRSSAIAGDIKTYDVGKIHVITNNAAAAGAFGKLYLEYDVEFFVPKSSPLDSTVSQGTSFFANTVTQNLVTGVGEPIEFNNAPFDPLNIGLPTVGVFTPPAGCYRIVATTSLVDGTNESFAGNLYLYKNGAALSVPVASTCASAPRVGGEVINLSICGIISMNGSDTFQIQVVGAGAAGALAILDDSSQLLISLA